MTHLRIETVGNLMEFDMFILAVPVETAVELFSYLHPSAVVGREEGKVSFPILDKGPDFREFGTKPQFSIKE